MAQHIIITGTYNKSSKIYCNKYKHNNKLVKLYFYHFIEDPKERAQVAFENTKLFDLIKQSIKRHQYTNYYGINHTFQPQIRIQLK